MAAPSRTPCAFCGKGIAQSTTGGRRKDYCTVPCRRRAQRRRDQELRTSRPSDISWHKIADDLAFRARQLNATGADQLPLATVLEATELLRQDAECLAAVAVSSARLAGSPWKEVAGAIGLTEASARARWGGVRVPRLLSARVPLSSTRPPHQERPPASCTESGPLSGPPRACDVGQHTGLTEGERGT